MITIVKMDKTKKNEFKTWKYLQDYKSNDIFMLLYTAEKTNRQVDKSNK